MKKLNIIFKMLKNSLNLKILNLIYLLILKLYCFYKLLKKWLMVVQLKKQLDFLTD